MRKFNKISKCNYQSIYTKQSIYPAHYKNPLKIPKERTALIPLVQALRFPAQPPGQPAPTHSH